jgi:LPXTG-site transpeptidase (sortase) family protein
LYDPAEHSVEVVAPVVLSVPAIGIENAAITPVGVYLDGRFEVPDAKTVGWYRFGPAPQDDGVTVLAAHLNFDGVDGVFRRLDDVDIDDQVFVASADGSLRAYRVTERRLIPKNELPPDEIWARSGESRLVLITCGGRYDASRRSYDDNVVVFADLL